MAQLRVATESWCGEEQATAMGETRASVEGAAATASLVKIDQGRLPLVGRSADVGQRMPTSSPSDAAALPGEPAASLKPGKVVGAAPPTKTGVPIALPVPYASRSMLPLI